MLVIGSAGIQSEVYLSLKPILLNTPQPAFQCHQCLNLETQAQVAEGITWEGWVVGTGFKSPLFHQYNSCSQVGKILPISLFPYQIRLLYELCLGKSEPNTTLPSCGHHSNCITPPWFQLFLSMLHWFFLLTSCGHTYSLRSRAISPSFMHPA